MNTTAIPFGLKGSDMVSVDQVESGLTCGCVCPECHGELVARKGEKNIWYFAHYSLFDCKSALETSIHLMAKEILLKAQTFKIPSIEVEHPQTRKTVVIREATDIKIDRITVEEKLNEIRPDIVIVSSGRKMLVEIFVTHKVSSKKLKKVKEYGHACLEIDCREWRKMNSSQKFSDFLVKGIQNKKWIYNKLAEKALDELRRDYEKRKKGFAEMLADAKHQKQVVEDATDVEFNKKLQKVSDDHPLLKPYKLPQSEPTKFTDKQHGIVQGTKPVVCSNCGILTTNWSRLDTKTWTCTCKKCL